jgi:hypothetical protein
VHNPTAGINAIGAYGMPFPLLLQLLLLGKKSNPSRHRYYCGCCCR